MKNYFYFALLLAIGFASCQDDDNIDPYSLHHDGESVGSPFLPYGEYEAATHFTAGYVSQYSGKELSAIEYNVYEMPEFAEIIVSESNGLGRPGGILFSQVVTNQLIPFSWNQLNLGVPIDLDGGLWISLYFRNSPGESQTIGCDSGPAQGNGDWLYDDVDQQWQTYSNRVGESVNWSIRGVLQDE